MTFADEETQMLADITATFGVAVTLRRVVMGAFNATIGARAETNTDFAVSANRLPIEDAFVSGGGGSVGVNRRRYEVSVAQATVRPERGWRLIDGTDELEIHSVRRDVDQLNYVIECGGSR